MGSCQQRELTQQIVEEYEINVSRACKLTKLPRSQYYYQSKKDDTSLDDFNEFLNLTDEGKVDMIIDYLKSESWQREEAVFDIARERIII